MRFIVVVAHTVHVRHDSSGVIPGVSSTNRGLIVFFVYNESISITIDIPMYCDFGPYDSTTYEGWYSVSVSQYFYDTVLSSHPQL